MFHIHTIMYKMEWYWTAILVEYSLIVWNCSHNKPGVTCKSSQWHFSFRQIIFGWLLCTNVDTLDRQSVTSRHHSLIYSDYTAAESTPININLSSSLFWGIQLHWFHHLRPCRPHQSFPVQNRNTQCSPFNFITPQQHFIWWWYCNITINKCLKFASIQRE